MSEQKFRFVPPFVIDMARDAMAFLPGWALDDIKKEGAFSAYELRYVNEAGKAVTCRIGYDFGLTTPEAGRGAVLALRVAKLTGIECAIPTVTVTPAEPISEAEAAELPAAEVETVIETVEIDANPTLIMEMPADVGPYDVEPTDDEPQETNDETPKKKRNRK